MDVFEIVAAFLIGFAMMMFVIVLTKAEARPAECAQLEAANRKYTNAVLDADGLAFKAMATTWYHRNCRDGSIRTRSKKR